MCCSGVFHGEWMLAKQLDEILLKILTEYLSGLPFGVHWHRNAMLVAMLAATGENVQSFEAMTVAEARKLLGGLKTQTSEYAFKLFVEVVDQQSLQEEDYLIRSRKNRGAKPVDRRVLWRLVNQLVGDRSARDLRQLGRRLNGAMPEKRERTVPKPVELSEDSPRGHFARILATLYADDLWEK